MMLSLVSCSASLTLCNGAQILCNADQFLCKGDQACAMVRWKSNPESRPSQCLMPRWAGWAGSALRGLCNGDEYLMHCAGEGVDPAVIERVRETMMACSQQCQNAMRAEGIKVLALFSQDVQSMANIKCHVQTAKWRRILDVSARPPAHHLPASVCC